MMKYKISNEAQNDIEIIWLYTLETWSIGQADRYYSLIFDEIEFICENPDSGKDCSHIRKGYLRTKVKSHFIFHKVNSKENLVEIIRILDQQMDIENRLSE